MKNDKPQLIIEDIDKKSRPVKVGGQDISSDISQSDIKEGLGFGEIIKKMNDASKERLLSDYQNVSFC